MNRGEETLKVIIGNPGFDFDGIGDKVILSLCEYLKGDKGDKPIYGVDYWTEADKQGIIDDMLESVGTGWVWAWWRGETLVVESAGSHFDGETMVLAPSSPPQA